MNWSQEFECGLERFDTSNQCLIFVLRQVLAPGGECRGHPACGQQASDCTKTRALQTFASRKFAFEERVMRGAEFPGLPEHAEDHRQFLSRIEMKGPPQTCLAGLSEIERIADLWLPLHVDEFDRSFGRWTSALP